MLNVDQITSELARLPDNSLQRYAMMHKDDPYVLSLAMSESNRRKQMRAGAHMQAPQQPTVVEQQLAGMGPMPEEVGIGTLPTPNMQHFDDGGIVGYADGGANPASGPAGQLAYNNEPVLRMAGGGVARYADEGLVKDQAVYDPATGLPIFDTSTTASSDDRTLMEKLGIFNPENRRALAQLDRDLASRAEKKPATTAAVKPADTAPAVRPVSESPLVKPPARTPAKEAAAAPPPAGGGLSALAAAQKMPEIDPLAQAQAMSKAIYGEQQKLPTIQELIAERDKYMGASPLQAQLDRLAKQDEAAKKEKSDAGSMALIKAGLTMMNPPRTAGGKFAGLLAGIGAGAGAGLEDYQVAMKELKAADREREKMRMDIERGQYAEKAGKWDKATDSYEKAADRQAKIKDHIMQAASTSYGETIRGQFGMQQAKLAGEYGLERERLQGLNALRAANAQLNAPGAQEKLFATLGGGDVAKGMRVYSEAMGTEAKGENALIAQYAKDPVALKMLEQTNPQLASLVRMRIQQMLMPGVQTAPSAGGVRP